MNAWAVATILAIPTAVVALVVSYATERPSESQLRNLTWYSLREPGDVYNEDISVPYGTIADAHLDGDDNQAMSSPNEFVHNVINPRSIDGVE